MRLRPERTVSCSRLALLVVEFVELGLPIPAPSHEPPLHSWLASLFPLSNLSMPQLYPREGLPICSP